jgi:aryl-alcohol dehydrogenase-like predicted oxidoreductase
VEPSRRDILALATFVAGCGRDRRAPPAVTADRPPVPPVASISDAAEATPMITRSIPSTSEALAAIGLGSWQTFDVAPDEVASVQPVLARFLERGGRVVDSSPMYGQAEAAIGSMLASIAPASPPFLATKVWTSGDARGQAEMRRSLELLQTKRLDLMQIHNLLDWKTHLKTLRAWKDAGTFRYIGVTHYQQSAFGELEQILRREKIDFIQLPYSVSDREAEKRLLPAAAETGTAVLVMQPFDSGGLFDRVRDKAVPPVAAELGATSWAQLFLLWILGHPAVTAPIPATSKVKHLEDNMAALRMKVPDAAQRDAIAKAVDD